MNVYEMEGFLRGKCLPGDLKVNESNAEYLVRKLNVASGLKGELTAALATIEKCREITNCPAGVDLQDHLRQLAAENVGLKAAHPQPFGSEMMRALEAYEWHQEDCPETGMLEAYFILRDSISVETPATDRIYDEAEARGVEKLIEHLVNNGYDSVANGVKAYMQLREGAK